ncbi:MAG: hypothetical protein AAFQ65_05905 [Myxococcota bacterium]
MLRPLIAFTLFATSVLAYAAESDEEAKRRQILEKLGLTKTEKASQDEGSDDNDQGAQGESTGEDSPEDDAPSGRAAENETTQPGRGKAEPRKLLYVPRVHAILISKCQRCHREGGKAKKGDLMIVDEPRASFDMARRYVTPGDLEKSALYTQALGNKHKGGKTLKPDTVEEKLLARWIQDGALFGSAKASKAASPPAVVSIPAAPTPASPVPTAGSGSSGSSKSRDAAPSEPASPAGEDGAVVSEATTAPVVDNTFRTAVYPALQRGCVDCHGGEPGDDGFVVSEDIDATFQSTVAYVALGSPDESALINQPTGSDDHEVVWGADAPDLIVVRAWIHSLEEAAPPAVAAQATPEPTGPERKANGPRARPPREPLGDGTLTGRYKQYGIHLPYGFRINGRFDLNYERRNFTGNPFTQDADATLRSFHNFLFMTRDPGTEGVPFGISIEVTQLQFWEAYFLYEPEAIDLRLLLRIGRILVPFGAEPLFHNSYGGLAAFDQQLLPVFWAQEGIGANLQYRFGPLTVANDFYVIRGFQLNDPEGRLDLQGGFSPRDDVELGVGDRVGVSIGPLSAWYSIYFNGLEAGRRLVMQAVDAMIFRPDLPVLEYFSFAAGFMRADVSGGGPGIDYYDFGDYWELHAYPLRGVDLRYRQGIRTLNNQKDFIFDERRISSDDGSTHSIGATFRYRGLSLAAHHFWNLEEADEVEDDILRFTVAYDF